MTAYTETMPTSNNAPTTDADWGALISTTLDSLPSSYTVYHTPRPGAIHRAIEHILLTPDATDRQIDKLCFEAHYHKFVAVCVRPRNVNRAVQYLEPWPEVAVACVVAFPEGTQDTTDKEEEARNAIEQGATEIVMVANWPLLKQKKYSSVYTDILEVRKSAAAPVKLKVILETPQLSRTETMAGCVIACLAGADFLQTSTGLKEPGATTDLIGMMRATADLVGRGTKVKASDDFHTAEDCIQMLKAGADRVESSSSMDILQELGSEELQEQGVGHSMY